MEKNAIKVSVIVPAYNVEGYIEACLNSLVNQTMKEIEIIVINDGSTDKTSEIIQKYSDRVVVINQENKGLAETRNVGIRIANGEYIGFVDSDDWVDLDYFEKLYNSAKENDADMSVASILKHKLNYDRYNLQIKRNVVAESVEDKYRVCQDKTKRFFYVWNKLCRTSLIKDKKILFPTGRNFEDVTFSMQTIFYSNKIVTVPDVKYHYIERRGSIVKSNMTEKKRNDHDVAYKELQEFAMLNKIKLPERLNYINNYWKTPLLKIYEGRFFKKFVLFGVLPILKIKKNEG